MKVFVLIIVIFISSSSGIIVNCRFVNTGWDTETQYTCEVSQVDISENDTALLDVRGTHQTNKANKDVGGLSFWGTYPLDRMPTNIESFFPNLEAIRFWNGNLTHVSAEILLGFQNLALFDVSYNKLATIEGDLFKYSPNIQKVYFIENLITNVGHDLLTGLTKLTDADFRYNPCINILSTNHFLIPNLIKELLIQCPPLATTSDPPTTTTTTTSTPSECDVRCTINSETDELRSQVDVLADATEELEERLVENDKRLADLQEQLALQKAEIIVKFIEQEGRINELEKRLRELGSNPRAPCSST